MTEPAPDPVDRTVAALALDTKADARSRGFRTALQVAAVSVLVDGAVIANEVLDAFDDGEQVDWSEPGRALIRVLVAAVLAVAMRYHTPPPTA